MDTITITWVIEDIAEWGLKNVTNIYEDIDEYAQAIFNKYQSSPALLRDPINSSLYWIAIDSIADYIKRKENIK